MAWRGSRKNGCKHTTKIILIREFSCGYYYSKILHHAHFSVDLLSSFMTVLVKDMNAYFPRKRNTSVAVPISTSTVCLWVSIHAAAGMRHWTPVSSAIVFMREYRQHYPRSSKYAVMLYRVDWHVITDVSTDRSAFILMDKQGKNSRTHADRQHSQPTT
jgi:hypothetical protein